jgi:toxin-antitoxin system PIN domain toxin
MPAVSGPQSRRRSRRSNAPHLRVIRLAVDTNVLVYASNRSATEHAPCLSLVERCRVGPLPWFLSWNIIYEYLRVVTHPRVLPNPWPASAAWSFVEALLASPSLTLLGETERHGEVVRATVVELPFLAGNLLHDAHTAVLMREHGVRRIATRDADFHRFPFLEVVDPLSRAQ